jgi:hypothetical protein
MKKREKQEKIVLRIRCWIPCNKLTAQSLPTMSQPLLGLNLGPRALHLFFPVRIDEIFKGEIDLFPIRDSIPWQGWKEGRGLAGLIMGRETDGMKMGGGKWAFQDRSTGGKEFIERSRI